jgi:hypothetical protein
MLKSPPAAFSYRSDPQRTREGTIQAFTRAALPVERRVLTRWGWAGENRELFEHPARLCLVVPDMWTRGFLTARHRFLKRASDLLPR